MTTWEHGAPDPLCAICDATGKARVRARRPERGARLVVSVRLVPSTVDVLIDENSEPAPGDRLVTCPSCMETDDVRAAGLEGSTLAVRERARRR